MRSYGLVNRAVQPWCYVLRVRLYLHFMRRTLDMNGIYYPRLNESNLTSLGYLIGRKSHQSCRYNLHTSRLYIIYPRTYLCPGHAHQNLSTHSRRCAASPQQPSYRDRAEARSAVNLPTSWNRRRYIVIIYLLFIHPLSCSNFHNSSKPVARGWSFARITCLSAIVR